MFENKKEKRGFDQKQIILRKTLEIELQPMARDPENFASQSDQEQKTEAEEALLRPFLRKVPTPKKDEQPSRENQKENQILKIDKESGEI